jgi:hypothetical protein
LREVHFLTGHKAPFWPASRRSSFVRVTCSRGTGSSSIISFESSRGWLFGVC